MNFRCLSYQAECILNNGVQSVQYMRNGHGDSDHAPKLIPLQFGNVMSFLCSACLEMWIEACCFQSLKVPHNMQGHEVTALFKHDTENKT